MNTVASTVSTTVKMLLEVGKTCCSCWKGAISSNRPLTAAVGLMLAYVSNDAAVLSEKGLYPKLHDSTTSAVAMAKSFWICIMDTYDAEALPLLLAAVNILHPVVVAVSRQFYKLMHMPDLSLLGNLSVGHNGQARQIKYLDAVVASE